MSIKHIIFLWGLIFVLGQSNLAQATPRAGIVATVNGEIISSLDLEKSVITALKSRGVSKSDAEYEAMANEVRPLLLQSLIEEKIFMMEAEAESALASDEDVASEVAMQISRTNLSEEEFFLELANTGITRDDFYNKIKVNITTQKLIGLKIMRNIVVTDEEVDEYQRRNSVQMDSEVSLAVIVYDNINDAVKHGEAIKNNPDKFSDLAKEISIGPNAADGGMMPISLISELSAAVRFQIEKLQAGEVSNIFSLGGKEAQIKLIEISSSSGQSAPELSADEKDKIIDEITELKARTMIAEYLAKLKSKAIISIK